MSAAGECGEAGRSDGGGGAAVSGETASPAEQLTQRKRERGKE